MGLQFEWDTQKARQNIKKHGVSLKKMKNDSDLLGEYDFSGGVRGKYAKRYAEGTNLVAIEPDVARYFPDHDAVNDALRGLAAIIEKQAKPKKRVTSRTTQPATKKPVLSHH